MRIETVCTGDELLTGLIADTNSTYFQERLLDRLGVTVRRSAVVGDVREDIVAALTEAAGRADAVLVSGGLGPTADDFTAECAAKAAGVELVNDRAAEDHIRTRFASRKIQVTPNNLRQAMVPFGSEVIMNAEGSAPMFVMHLKACTFFFVPGVPREYRFLVENEVLPRLEKLKGGDAARRTLAVLKCVGLFESQLDARVQPLYVKHPEVVFGFRTRPPENHLKLLGPPEAVAAARLDCLDLLGEHVFAEGTDTMPGAVAQALLAKKHRLALAESLTGGMIAAELTAVPGASTWLESSAVTYTETAKQRLAGVEPEALKEHGAVSELVARQMAMGVRTAAGVEWGGAATGIAGPSGGTEKNPVGTVYLAVMGPRVDVVERHTYPAFDRERVRRAATWGLMDLLRRKILSALIVAGPASVFSCAPHLRMRRSGE